MKKLSFTKLLTMLLAMAVVIGVSTTQHAHALSIRLSGSTITEMVGGVAVPTIITVNDGDVLDQNPLSGGVAYTSFGVLPLSINIQSGESLPIFGRPGVSSLKLSTIINSAGTGDIKIEFSDEYGPLLPDLTGFSFGGGGFNGGAKISYSAYYGTTLFDTATLIGSFGPNTSFGGFSGNTLFSGIPGGAHSLTMVANISFEDSNGGSMSLDAATVPTPEPASLILMGSGLVGLGLWGRRRAKKSSV